jgi:DNA-binding LacI/PurR family transcriptional regulator
MVTIYDIAKACGLTASTVSKALNNYKTINAETVAKVKRTARSMGYLPNASARNLITKRTANIGVLIYIPNAVGLKHSLFMSILNSFKTALEREKYDITFMSKEYADSYLNHCRTRGFDGVLVLGDFSPPAVAEVLESDLPVVCFDYRGAAACGVGSDNRESTAELTRHLISLGHKRILYVEGESNYVTSNRRNGFTAAMDAAGLPTDGLIVNSHYFSMEETYNLVASVLREEKGITAFMLPDDHAAIGGMNAIWDAGLRIPEDISVTGYDGIELSQIIKPRLTTVRQNTEEIGGKLAEVLLGLISGKAGEKGFTEIPAEMVVGQSTGRVKE